jgi:TetR/AcrR family transcriptional regulator, transcriptional repressor for nem operon
MRKSKAEAAETRTAIVDAAADHIRTTGIAGASLAEIMAAAGLTHGGFYKHFRNKNQLVQEALAVAGEETLAAVAGWTAKGGPKVVADFYLSTQHRDGKSPLCLFAALGSELARADRDVKRTATGMLEQFFEALAQDPGGGRDRADTIADFATMVGALTLARLAADKALSAEILESAKKRLAG